MDVQYSVIEQRSTQFFPRSLANIEGKRLQTHFVFGAMHDFEYFAFSSSSNSNKHHWIYSWKDIAMINRSKMRISESQKLFAPLGNIQSRSQFGGYSLSANGIMFALISGGELYLRATPKNEIQFRRQGMESLIYHKRGIPISLRYFKVGIHIWKAPDKLLILAKSSLQGMLNDKKKKKNGDVRLKDLPNISLNLERLLWQIGISTSSQLRAQGACLTYLKLRSVKDGVGLNVLIALEGAIHGYHEAALPMASRDLLTQWYASQTSITKMSAE